MSDIDATDMLAAVAKKRAQGNKHSITINDEIILPADYADTPKKKSLKRKGRRKGKRSDPNYKQTGVYLPADLTNRVKKRLYDSEMDFSDLIADLLADWEAEQTAKDN